MALAGSGVELLASVHAAALARLEQGDADGALAELREGVRTAFDPEAVNDLAVLTAQAGKAQEAAELLRALVRLHPEHSAARENLEALAPARAAEAGSPAAGAEPGSDRAGRRVRFLQTIADGLATHLADNVDHLFEPWGRELPEAAGAGEGIAAQLEVLESIDAYWSRIGDEASRELTLRLLAYRALGPAHIRLQLDPQSYRRTVIGMTATALRRAMVEQFPGFPFEWQMHHYDLEPLGLPIQVIGPPLPIASTMAFSQYAYRDAAAGAGPRPGDIALDAGGCWGDTALWLAHVVGPAGQVHTFEPTPGNRRLLAANLELNPALRERIVVHEAPLAAAPGETVWLPDVIAAGATMQESPQAPPDRRMIPARTDSIDALVDAGGIPRVDFLKVDVEGADLGVLEGAAETIRRDRPRLALAAYHKPDDLAVLPGFIAGLGIEYRWYLQCSTMTDVDTVAFGVPA